MSLLFPAAAGVVGLAVGSFLNVVAWRLPRGESLARPGSRCPGCGHPLRARDNVPVLSWLLLRGRCRDCAAPIPARYPLVELTTGVVFGLLAARFGPTAALPAYCYLAAVGVALAVIDLRLHRLPDQLTLPSYPVAAVLLAAASLAGHHPGALLRAGLGMAAFYALYLLLCLVGPGGGMGFGDVKLAGVLGGYLAWLGWGSWAVGLFAGFFLGGAVGVALLATGRAGRKSRLAFGPFMLAGALVAILAGGPVTHVWLHGAALG